MMRLRLCEAYSVPCFPSLCKSARIRLRWPDQRAVCNRAGDFRHPHRLKAIACTQRYCRLEMWARHTSLHHYLQFMLSVGSPTFFIIAHRESPSLYLIDDFDRIATRSFFFRLLAIYILAWSNVNIIPPYTCNV